MTDHSQTVAAEISKIEYTDIITAVTKFMDEGECGVRLAGYGLDGSALRDSISTAVKGTLDISLFDMCQKAWEGVKSVRDLTSDNGPMDGKPRIAALAKHELKAKHKPEIHLTIAEAIDLYKVSLPVVLTAKVLGVAITVVDRKITTISAGHMDVSLSISVEKVKIVERKLKRFDFSKALKLAQSEDESEQRLKSAFEVTEKWSPSTPLKKSKLS
jgi:hypothetical protein